MPTFSQDDYNLIVEDLFSNDTFKGKPKDVVDVILHDQYLDGTGQLVTMNFAPGNSPHEKYLSSENLEGFAGLELDAEQINKLAKCKQIDDKFYKRILLNTTLTNFNKFDSTLLAKLAENAASKTFQLPGTKADQFIKIVSSDNVDSKVIDVVVANPQSEHRWFRRRAGVDDAIFKQLRDPADKAKPNPIANKLHVDTLSTLAARVESLDDFKLILASDQVKDKKGSAIIESIVNNKAFSGNKWLPNFIRNNVQSGLINDKKITDAERLILIPHIEDSVLLKRMAQNISKTEPEAGAEDIALKLGEAIINKTTNKEIADIILANKALVKRLPTKSLDKLAELATTSEQFNNILTADNAKTSTANKVISKANEQKSKGVRGFFRGVGSFFRRMFNLRVPNVPVEGIVKNIFEAEDAKGGKKFPLKELDNESLRILSKSMNNAEEANRSKYKGHINEVINVFRNKAVESVQGKTAAHKTAGISLTETGNAVPQPNPAKKVKNAPPTKKESLPLKKESASPSPPPPVVEKKAETKKG